MKQELLQGRALRPKQVVVALAISGFGCHFFTFRFLRGDGSRRSYRPQPWLPMPTQLSTGAARAAQERPTTRAFLNCRAKPRSALTERFDTLWDGFALRLVRSQRFGLSLKALCVALSFDTSSE